MAEKESAFRPPEQLAAAVIADPGLIDRLKADPIAAAASVGVTLNQAQADRIRNIDASKLAKIRTAVGSGDTTATISASTGLW